LQKCKSHLGNREEESLERDIPEFGLNHALMIDFAISIIKISFPVPFRIERKETLQDPKASSPPNDDEQVQEH
jgi:hypothetical protein